MWNINALPHLFFCLPSTSCLSQCNNHLSPLSPSLSFLIVHPSLCSFLSPILACHLSSSSFPSSCPSVVVSPPTPIHVHTSQVSARPYTPLPSLGGVAVVTGKMDDRQGPMPAPPLLFETPHTSCWLPTDEYHTSLTQRRTNSNVEVSCKTSFDVSPLFTNTCCSDVHTPYFEVCESTQELQFRYHTWACFSKL